MFDIWTEKSGISLGTINERTVVDIPLPVTYSSFQGSPNDIKFQVISGKLPSGFRIEDDRIVGTAFEVPRVTEFKFCIRASYLNDISDRTFKFTIEGSDEPEFLTPEDLLPVGPNNTYFILDSSYIDFQIQARDDDTAAGQKLEFFISSGDGELPPGLRLTEDGRIIGYVAPLEIVPVDSRDGGYGIGLYDTFGYDYGVRPDNGYDTFVYDSLFYDYFLPVNGPRKLNRNYEFIITVSDGDTISRRRFKIYVVGDDFLTSDNTLISAGNGIFRSDGTNFRAPLWITPSDLGLYRANNYVTVFLDVYQPSYFEPVIYNLDNLNPDTTPSLLPPGMQLDLNTGEIFGVIPYQPAVTKTYRFTVKAIRLSGTGETIESKRTFTLRTLGEVDSFIKWITPITMGSIDANFISTLKVEAESTVPSAVLTYTLMSGNLPPGLILELNGEITGKVNQYPAPGVPGMFTLSDSSNGSTYPNQTLDGGMTTIDKEFKFIVSVKDQFGYSEISREFVLRVNTPNDRLYSNISAKTYMSYDKRSLFETFIRNSSVFPPEYIYRPSDPNFGLRNDLKMIIYAGIETKSAAEYVSKMGLNHKRKTFAFGDIKLAKAKLPGTDTVVYEMIYIEMIDPLEKGKLKLPSVLKNLSLDPYKITTDMSNAIWANQDQIDLMNNDEPYLPRPYDRITADQTSIDANNTGIKERYPSSISIWRDKLSQAGLTERNYLPLWMRSIQDNSKQELGFVLAVPLCYCKPGTGNDILLNIKFSGFDFKRLEYTVDRYIIDSVTGYGSDKYLVFKNDKVTV